MIRIFAIGILVTVMGILAFLLLRERRHNRIEQENRERNSMIALLSHRLRTPLTSVKWYTELLLNQEFGRLQISQLEFLNKINTSISDAIQVLNRFLEVSRVERGDIATEATTIDVADAAKGVAAALENQYLQKQQHLNLHHGDKHVLACVNPLVFHNILEVLVSNAITYTPERGTIDIHVNEDAAQVSVTVQDTGVGIPLAEQKKLFTKFYRGAKAREISPNGNGLGLYLVKDILSQIGGSVRCESQEGKGTSFTVMIPKNGSGGAA